MTIIIFLLVLAVLVFVHELGHFLAAKLFKIRVDEFALGFPPRIVSKKIGETTYAINSIPFGGYVKIYGEDIEEGVLMSEEDKKRNLSFAPRWKQIVILLSGILFNIIFAWILISISFMQGMLVPVTSEMVSTNSAVIITSIEKDSPAEIAGLQIGDKILSINSTINPKVEDVQVEVAKSEIVELKVERENTSKDISLSPKVNDTNKKLIGISMSYVGTVKYGFWKSFYEGGKLTITETRQTAVGLGKFIGNAVTAKKGTFSDVSGPVGIAKLSGQAAQFGFSYFLGFVSIISINLALINLVPFPALDGGRVFLILIETIFRKKIKPVIFNLLNGIGFILLILLMVVITVKDVIKLFQ